MNPIATNLARKAPVRPAGLQIPPMIEPEPAGRGEAECRAPAIADEEATAGATVRPAGRVLTGTIPTDGAPVGHASLGDVPSAKPQPGCPRLKPPGRP
jgi:hypothetical protein